MKWFFTYIILLGSFYGQVFAQSDSAAQSLQEQILRLHHKGDSCKRIESYARAIEFKKKELALLLHFNDMDRIADCGDIIGLLYYHLSAYHESLNYFEKSSGYYKRIGDMFSYATTKVNQSNVYTRIGKYEEAIKQMKLAEEAYMDDTVKYAAQLVGLYVNLGLAYFELPNLDSAGFYYQKAKIANETAKSKLYDAVLLNNEGDIFIENGNIDNALSHFQKSLQLAEDLDYVLLIATTKFNMGRVFTIKEDYNKAIQYFNEALVLYKEIESLYFIAETNKELSKCYAKMNSHDQAFKYLQQFNYLDDSLRGIKTLDRIAQLELEVALQEEKSKTELVKQQKELAETKSRHQNTYLQLLIGLIILGLISAVLLIRTLRTRLERNKLKTQHLQQKQQLLQNEINFKRKEIENFSTYILEKNNILSEVKESLSKIKKAYPDSDLVHKSLQTVNHNLHIDQDRKELDLKIDQAHQEFIARLLEKHPKLTKTEVRLCSLILMDLSTKDISFIMSVAQDSVKKSRNRLRKKLDLAPKSDLFEFLKSI